MSKDTKARLTDGIKTESLHVARLQLPGLRKKVILIHILPKNDNRPTDTIGGLM